ncbi:hypothetical protein [Rhizobium ruizarguesonis]|uniref:hypothetical protein n=1 Tax=Rhizobium ruizarguesonis TaxID=2081791 RepID=UPI001031F820|nr:hypothetical protein [Rhizobium ruizarguesonis]TBE07211.1 hypothetical protein ELH12_14910 [Rhizobium ruizarguesonis]TBE78436.1 hypothetical protein ELH01_15085 [Rhizobium ruizarguesonis]
MMLRILSGFFSLLLLSCLSWSALAADKTCPQRETILSFSDIVLADRAALPPLIAKRYGAEAAYLKIRYAPLSDEETRGLLQTLLTSNVRTADDLAYAWHIHREGYEATIASLGQEQFDMLVTTLGTSTIRALLLNEGGEDTLMKRLAPIATEPRSKAPGAFTNGGGAVAAAIIDQPDEFKKRIVLAAEAQGLVDIAAYVSASENNPQAWNAFLKRGVGKPSLYLLYASQMRAMVGNPRLERPNIQSALQQDAIHRIQMATALEPEQDFLLNLMNQTGAIASVDRMARILTQQIQSGAIRRNGTMDAAWLFAYRSAVHFLGHSQIDPLFDRLPYSGRRYVRSSSIFMMRDVIDQLLVVEALQPYVTGKVSDVPPWPAGVSDKIKADWPRWTEMAAKVRDGTVSPTLAADPATFGIVAELLFAKADQPALRAFVEQAPAGQARVSVANDFAIRLDRACAAYLYHPTEAGTLQGQPIFKFDTQ